MAAAVDTCLTKYRTGVFAFDDALNSSIPTGHIHTPRIQQFEPETEAKIVNQIKAMLEQSLVAL